MDRLPRLLLVPVLGALLAGPLAADTVVVSPGQSIQAAIDEAPDGSTIVIVKGTYQEAVVLSGRSDLVLRGKGAVILKTPLGEGPTPGLVIDGSSDVELVKLQFVDTAGHAIHVMGSTGVRIQRCWITGAQGDGVRVDDSNGARIERNRIEDVAGHGVALSAGLELQRTNGSLVARNRIRQPGGDGVALNGSDNTVERNRIEAAQDDGVEIEEGSTDASGNAISRNRILAPVDTGLRAWGTGNTFDRNKVFDAGLLGGRLGGAGNTFERNRFVRIPGGHGVDAQDDFIPFEGIEPGGHVAIRNVVVDAGADGFLMLTSQAYLERNVVRSPVANGITVVLRYNDLIKNRVQRAGLVGFKIFGEGFHILDGNRAVKNGNTGFLTTSSHCLFQNNRARGNPLDWHDLGENCYREGNVWKTAQQQFPSDCSDYE